MIFAILNKEWWNLKKCYLFSGQYKMQTAVDMQIRTTGQWSHCFLTLKTVVYHV